VRSTTRIRCRRRQVLPSRAQGNQSARDVPAGSPRHKGASLRHGGGRGGKGAVASLARCRLRLVLLRLSHLFVGPHRATSCEEPTALLLGLKRTPFPTDGAAFRPDMPVLGPPPRGPLSLRCSFGNSDGHLIRAGSPLFKQEGALFELPLSQNACLPYCRGTGCDV
jgi:hypothetical protein